jgi:hypothetical protein
MISVSVGEIRAIVVTLSRLIQTVSPRLSLHLAHVGMAGYSAAVLIIVVPSQYLPGRIDQVHSLAGQTFHALICVVAIFDVVIKPLVNMKACIGAEKHHARYW